MTRTYRHAGWWLASALVALGCGAARVPQELRDARNEYNAAAEGQAAQLAPAELHVARTALDKAEKQFRDEGNEKKTRDLAYIAHRKVLFARAVAGTIYAQQQREQALAAQRRAEQERLSQAQQQLDQTQEQLDAERHRREHAETASAEAMRKLEEANAVKRDQRGLVITVSGTVLFQSGQADVMPSAHERLVEVCTAVKDQPGKIIIEGHTDSKGSSEGNMILSRRRAESVLAVMAANGVPRERMEAIGYGESRPIADNGTAEGRANNRRVEIVIRPEAAVTSQR